jgi:drug/metabolite transporter (DMT)-like permease
MVLIVFGCCSFTVGHIYCNENKFHPVETSMVRGFSVVVICYFFLRYLKLDMTFKSTHNLKWLIARNSIMVVHNFAYIISQYYLPLPIAITLSSTSPLFVFIYDYYLFGVTINRKQVVFLMVSIMGVIITSNSSYLITFIDADFDFEQSNFDGYQTSDPVVRTYAGIAVVLVMMMHGYGLLLTKKLVDVHTAHINFIQGLAILFASSIIFPIA